jgi:hypothetical protein
LRRKAVQPFDRLRVRGLGLRGADIHAKDLATAIGIDTNGDDDGDRDDTAVLPDLHVGRVDPQVRPVALDRPVEEGLYPLVDLLAQSADLALGDATHPHGLDQLVDRAGRDALDVGLLDDGGQRLLGHAPGLQEAREVAAAAQLGDAQLDRAGPGLPVAVAVAVALHQAVGVLLAVRRACQRADLDLHQPLGREGDHLPQQVGIRRLFHERTQVHHLIGHRWSLGSRLVSQPDPNPEIAGDHRKPAHSLRRCTGSALASGLATASYTTAGDMTGSSPPPCCAAVPAHAQRPGSWQ